MEKIGLQFESAFLYRDALPSAQRRRVSADSRRAPVGRAPCVHVGLSLLDDAPHKFVRQMRMRAAMAAAGEGPQ